LVEAREPVGGGDNIKMVGARATVTGCGGNPHVKPFPSNRGNIFPAGRLQLIMFYWPSSGGLTPRSVMGTPTTGSNVDEYRYAEFSGQL
jgi:hypothetical protein